MSQLTEEQKQEYLRHPSYCPYCLSHDIEAGEAEFDDGMWQKVRCLNCDERWLDVYALVGIEEKDEGG